MELITITFCETMLNAKDLPYVRGQLIELYNTSKETIETQISNHNEDEISHIVSQKKKACIDAFKDSISKFIDYWDEIVWEDS